MCAQNGRSYCAADRINDGAVDAADFTVWRDHLGTNFALGGNGDETGGSAGVVDQADYAFWKAYFGNPASNGAGALAGGARAVVPEPAGVAMLLAGLAGILVVNRRRP